ncbi:hypothetical protein [Agrilutibacter solisilvae]|uniref:Secreted protein n=1 Tax=Agrilutibacter solisilvae TaxID=2763317 RepID=A0A974XZU2_9GAMM|nr:hypothetical protein [Lysobacter solisilvae]QSX78816.1 hypothetical protein I8J32_002495 [Lysobacter solisilvae]
MLGILWSLLLCCALAACSKPEPIDKERKPEPQAAHVEAAAAPQTPIDRAKSVQDELDAADQRQRDAIEDAGG